MILYEPIKVKEKIDNIQENRKCRLCGDGDETVNRTIIECSKVTQREYRSMHDWVGKVIHREICQRCYIYKHESLLENVTHRFIRKFEKTTYDLSRLCVNNTSLVAITPNQGVTSMA